MKALNSLKQDNIECAYLYFYIHLITEIVCFYAVTRILKNFEYYWIIPFIYDALAFVPQSLIGYFSDKHTNINLCIYGIILLSLGLIVSVILNVYLGIIILCIGNGLIHVEGAETTLRCSNGKLSHSAIFVGGGSFGVIIGKLLAGTKISYLLILLLSLTMIPFALLAEYYKKDTLKNKNVCKNFNYHNSKLNKNVIILLTIFVVIVRAYMGYGIPTSWNKTVLESILLYSFMGIGKCLGGILSDAYGIRKTAIISVIFALPFLLFGDNNIYLSLIGIMLFSMTMSITLGLLVSVLNKTPGLAFGLTTIGLFLGTAPIFFFKFNTVLSNCILISILSIICLIILLYVIRKDEKYD